MRAKALYVGIFFLVCAGLMSGLEVLAGDLANPLSMIEQAAETVSPDIHRTDLLTFDSQHNLLADYPARNDDGSVNAVVEIPAGTNSKWEVKGDGKLHWDLEKEKPRLVQYLGYPCNYGMIPQTKNLDGDPLDVAVLGPAVPRGSVVKVHVVGVLQLNKRGERDDKLLAVMSDSPFANVQSVAQLQKDFPGVCDILRTWFTNYKGAASLTFVGFGEAADASADIETTSAAYRGAK